MAPALLTQQLRFQLQGLMLSGVGQDASRGRVYCGPTSRGRASQRAASGYDRSRCGPAIWSVMLDAVSSAVWSGLSSAGAASSLRWGFRVGCEALAEHLSSSSFDSWRSADRIASAPLAEACGLGNI